MSNFFIVAKQVCILFVLIGAGAACRRFKVLNDAAVKGMVDVLVLIVTPCLIVDVFQRPFDKGMLMQLAYAFAIAVAAHLALIAVAVAVFRRERRSSACVLKLASVFSNAGFMGIPLEQAILGEKGVFFGIVYVAVFNLFIWSWGLREMADAATDEAERRKTLRTMFLNPGTIGLALGLVFFLTSSRLPAGLAEGAGMLASMNTPLAMLIIGYYLAGAKLGAILKFPAAYVATAIRLVLYPLAFTGAMFALRKWLDRDAMLALVTAASAPVAAMTSMFAAKFKRDVDLSVALVSGTTLLSVVTMPAVIAFAMGILER